MFKGRFTLDLRPCKAFDQGVAGRFSLTALCFCSKDVTRSNTSVPG